MNEAFLMRSLTYRPYESRDFEPLRDLLMANGWERRVADPERFRQILERADRNVVAVDDAGRILGFGRALCDGVSNGYLSMLVVHPDHRRRGIGRAIVERLIGDDPRITWVLRAGRDSAPFWQRLGFTHSTIAMERVRHDA